LFESTDCPAKRFPLSHESIGKPGQSARFQGRRFVPAKLSAERFGGNRRRDGNVEDFALGERADLLIKVCRSIDCTPNNTAARKSTAYDGNVVGLF